MAFAGRRPDGALELELISANGRLRIELADSRGLALETLLDNRVRVTGLCRGALTQDGHLEPSLLRAPDAQQIEILGMSPLDRNESQSDFSELPVLTTVEEIKRLKRAEALRGYPVHIRGVVTWSGGSAIVIQDATAGIFVSQVPVVDADGLRAGELWDIEGISYAQFSPMVLARRVVRLGLGGDARTAAPDLGPADQWLAGHAVRRSARHCHRVAQQSVILLTHGGRIQLDLPETSPAQLLSFKDALVRVRGCLWAVKDDTTHLFKVGAVQIHNASIAVEQPAPADPFAAPRKRASELLLYDAQAGALQRLKVAGQIIHVRSGECFLMDDTNGLRFSPKANVRLEPGDLVEVVGFPDLNGPSPALREAVERQTGRAGLPPPLRLSEDTLLSGAHDSTRVCISGRWSG